MVHNVTEEAPEKMEEEFSENSVSLFHACSKHDK